MRRTLHNVSAEEAGRAMDTFRERVNREPAQPPPLLAPTFEEFYERYFPLIIEGLSPSTAKDYRLVAERCLLQRFGSWRLSEITAGAVNLWIRELKLERRAAGKRPLAGATINGYANILRAIVNYAVRFDVLEESPFKRRLEREKVNRPKNELSDRECAAFLDAFDDREAFVAGLRAKYRRGEVVPCERYPTPRVFGGSRRWDSEAANDIWEHFHALKPFFIVALTTGLRLGDLCRLTWKDVRWTEGWIQLVLEKTEREVVVPISGACEAALKECRARPVVGELVFVDEVGAPLSVTRIRRGFALAKKLASITRKVRFHDLRHTYGSSLASDGLSLAIISKVMGHASQITTARYARPDTRVFEAVREALDRRHGGSSDRR